MRYSLLIFLSSILSSLDFAANIPIANQFQQKLDITKFNNHISVKAEQSQILEVALNFLFERNKSLEHIKQYQQIIENFPLLVHDIRKKILSLMTEQKVLHTNMNSAELDQKILQASNQLLEESRQVLQEQETAREISYELSQLPQQQTTAKRIMIENEHRTQGLIFTSTSLSQVQIYMKQAENAANQARINELELAQLSSINQQELAHMRAELHQKKIIQLDDYLKKLRNNLNNQRQLEAKLALKRTENLIEKSIGIPNVISNQFQINRELSNDLNNQTKRMDFIAIQQQLITNQNLQVRQVLSSLHEQSRWIGASNLLGEALRTQIARLPTIIKFQQIDREMGELRVKRLKYEELLEHQQILLKKKQDNGIYFTTYQMRILNAQLKIQHALLNSLISSCDTLILEITKLKVGNIQLQDSFRELKDATHRYLFWIGDVNPIGLRYPIQVAQDLTRFLSLDTLNQLGKALTMMFTSKETLLPIISAILLVGLSIGSKRHYNAFMIRASSRVGKVTQDQFNLTLRTVLWSILVALPLPVLWAAFGYGLQHAWPYPVAIAIGDGITATLPLLLAFMISAIFARHDGLFVVHFRWPQKRVIRAMRYYLLTVGLIVPLIMLLIAFTNLKDLQFSASLGRLCFILICTALSIVTVSLKRAGIPLYLYEEKRDKEKWKEGKESEKEDDLINRILWNIMIIMPILALLASCIGYLSTAQALLVRLETSIGIWFFLLVIYHIIRRWMLIQRRRIAFDRARQRRADILANRARSEEEKEQSISINNDIIEIDEPVINLDEISAQSLRLVRSIITLIALVSLIVLWSEIHSAFSFLDNIELWGASTIVQGVESIHPITLGSVLIAILVFIITTQLVRNMPALLELALLQHLNLSPGTGYAITTLTKYILMLIGSLIGFSILGIDWSKLQWLVAALGLGLGFGLQEIFANFISGLIILFEKPIRIADTVTIRDLTGSVTRINTRATTITDWDRKEIIVPNKAFITEQFVNWSLSDSVTRVVLTVPAPSWVNSDKITEILKQAAERCTYVLTSPIPDVFLVDLQQGIQLFELRVHAAEMSHRMPLRHELHQLILRGFEENNIEIPFPPFQVRVETINKTISNEYEYEYNKSTRQFFKSGSL
ncbi:miniconductance mechanosensitive channel MscM [Pantoea sp. Aalb]|uniref:miniconductance mechanosensitive channel MscM n=1 Tax=Pantoea sp. Aalb TaxID=2576762 RepID=UPI0013251D94|nr:miniconductance mechanosensitive channel MscM [Pantoea sp. Aalb]MXP67668.1 miniconductance mechanosensitive channel MscM [Pantoea sp. Aalb]